MLGPQKIKAYLAQISSLTADIKAIYQEEAFSDEDFRRKMLSSLGWTFRFRPSQENLVKFINEQLAKSELDKKLLFLRIIQCLNNDKQMLIQALKQEQATEQIVVEKKPQLTLVQILKKAQLLPLDIDRPPPPRKRRSSVVSSHPQPCEDKTKKCIDRSEQEQRMQMDTAGSRPQRNVSRSRESRSSACQMSPFPKFYSFQDKPYRK